DSRVNSYIYGYCFHCPFHCVACSFVHAFVSFKTAIPFQHETGCSVLLLLMGKDTLYFVGFRGMNSIGCVGVTSCRSVRGVFRPLSYCLTSIAGKLFSCWLR